MSEAKERELRQYNLKQLLCTYLEVNQIRDKKAIEYIGISKHTFSQWINGSIKKLSLEAETRAWEFLFGNAYRPITALVSIDELYILSKPTED